MAQKGKYPRDKCTPFELIPAAYQGWITRWELGRWDWTVGVGLLGLDCWSRAVGIGLSGLDCCEGLIWRFFFQAGHMGKPGRANRIAQA